MGIKSLARILQQEKESMYWNIKTEHIDRPVFKLGIL